jgi:hypothetical protein
MSPDWAERKKKRAIAQHRVVQTMARVKRLVTLYGSPSVFSCCLNLSLSSCPIHSRSVSCQKQSLRVRTSINDSLPNGIALPLQPLIADARACSCPAR